ncbi:MATE family efflux transporter [Bordetella genomosp. 13]|uniref:MATE family efflux transporter n=1 Tax=Bordetella genomosp. 13 TaxID=463040 RepID=A0A1W6ZJH1_9BORD|nr:MATE family efflux transporter [Bordetella genomosp. 13]ARP97300.1 MATE family efflux transporter [Bordetella genomosp. 13]
MLQGPILPTLLRMSWPNMLMLLAQSGAALVETWFVARLGTDALAGVALVTPLLMLMQNMSQGAMGGGISSAVARALGAGRHETADSLVLHALVINLCLGVAFTAVFLLLGPQIYRALGAHGAALDAALTYSNVIFGGLVLMWVMNALASAVRGTGNMMVPGAVICGGALLVVPLSPCLIFGVGPLPGLGIAGGAWALLCYYAVGTVILAWYCISGRNAARLRRGALRPALLGDILSVGGLATLNPLLTNGLIAAVTALTGAYAGTAALAGYGTAARLEYLLMPIAFGLGAPMVAIVGANIGAGQPQRAVRVALTGGAVAFALGECLGILAAIWPEAWLRLFGDDPGMLAAGSTYLHIVGPFYGFFALGFSMYFASQGAGRLKWPLLAGLARLVVAVGGGWLVLRATGSLHGLFAVTALAMVLYGCLILRAVASPGWVRPARPR